MAGEFRYFAFNVVTGAALGELPLTGVSFSQRLNTPGNFTGNLDLLDPRVQAINPIQATAPNLVALFVDVLGTIVWGGIVHTRPFQRSTANKTPVGARETWSYFERRWQAQDYASTTTWATTPVDPMVIAGQVVSDAVAVPGSALSAGSGFPLSILYNSQSLASYPSGGTATPAIDWITQSYPIAQRQKIDQLVTQLSQLGYGVGFDFGIDWAWGAAGVGSTPVPVLNLSYPRRGRIAGSTGLVIRSSSLLDYGYPEDGTQQAWSLTGTGSGSGGLQSTQVADSAGIAGYPLLEDSVAFSSANSPSVVTNLALGSLTARAFPVVVPSVTFPALTDPTLGSYIVGDDIEVRIDPDERFPTGMDFFWRIVGVDVKVPDDGIATAMLTLNMPPGLIPVAPPA